MQILTPDEATKLENNIVREFCGCLNLWGKRETPDFDYNKHENLLLQVVNRKTLGREVLVNRVPVFRTWRARASSGAILGVGSRLIVGDWEMESE